MLGILKLCNSLSILLLPLAVTTTAVTTTGCATVSREVSRSEQMHFRALDVTGCRREMPAITADSLAQMSLEGPAAEEGISVYYNHGNDELARGVAQSLHKAFDAAREATGVELQEALRIYLVRVDEPPQSYDFALRFTNRTYGFPLFARVGTKTPAEVFEQNAACICLLTHEMTEMALVSNPSCSPVLCDTRAGTVTNCNYTRWFREGVASFAGYAAAEELRADLGPEAATLPFQHPYSSLARVRTSLFSWHQFSDGKLNDDNYDASLGLLFLIENRFGKGSVRKIVEGSRSLQYVDGKALTDLINKTFHTDLAKLVEDFRYPRLGLGMDNLTPALALNKGLPVDGALVTRIVPYTPAAVAGFENNDVIVAVNGRPVTNRYDVETALLAAAGAREAVMTVARGNSQQDLTVDVASAGVDWTKPLDSGGPSRSTGAGNARDIGNATYSWNFTFE